MVAGVHEQLGELFVDRRRREQAPPRVVGKQVGMPLHRMAKFQVAVAFEALFKGFQGVVEGRKVEAKHDVTVALPGRVASDVGAGEHGVELVAPPAVVVVLQQRHPQRLAEAPRADQKGA